MKKTNVQKKEQLFDFQNNAARVMGHFFMNPQTEFTLTEVAERTGLSKATLSRIIAKLRGYDVLDITEVGPSYRIRAKNSKTFRKEKIAYNFSVVIRSDIVEKLIGRFHNPKTIVLYGSFRKGEDAQGSDVDIAVEVAEGSGTRFPQASDFNDFEKLTQRKVNIHVFSRKEIDINVFENIANGFVLYGFLEVSK